MTECKRCRALEIRRGQTKGYITVPNYYSCSLGHRVTVEDNKVVCADNAKCIDKTTRRKSKCDSES